MKLFLISQNVNLGYGTYDSAVVTANTPNDATSIHPSRAWSKERVTDDYILDKHATWCRKSQVLVTYLGEAEEGIPRGVICASFHAE